MYFHFDTWVQMRCFHRKVAFLVVWSSPQPCFGCTMVSWTNLPFAGTCSTWWAVHASFAAFFLPVESARWPDSLSVLSQGKRQKYTWFHSKLWSRLVFFFCSSSCEIVVSFLCLCKILKNCLTALCHSILLTLLFLHSVSSNSNVWLHGKQWRRAQLLQRAAY